MADVLSKLEQEMEHLGSEPLSSQPLSSNSVAKDPLPAAATPPSRISATLSSSPTQEGKQEMKEDLDKEVWRCLNSVHEMLCHRQILNQTLRKGWMELASARYEMGPARISQNLFSLKAHAAKAVVDVTPPQIAGVDDEGHEEVSSRGPVVFEFVKDASERGQKGASYADESSIKKSKPLSQLRRRPVSSPAVQSESTDNERDGLLEYANLIDDSDSDDDHKPLEVQKNSLQGFGAMVVPNLRSAQVSFVKALQVVVDVLNAQSNATDAHDKAKKLKTSTDSFVGQ